MPRQLNINEMDHQTNVPCMKNTRPFLTVLFLLLLAPLHAQVMMPIGHEFLVNQQTSGTQSLPHVASDGNGGYVIVWTTTGSTIMARRYGADHQPLTDEIQVTTGATKALVYHWSEGRFVITWSGNPAGMKVLNADNSLSATYAMGGTDGIDMDIRGDELLVAFTASQHIHLRKWDLLTNTWAGASVQASEAPSANYQLPQVRWTSTGGIVAVYRGGGTTPHHIYRKTFNGNLLAQVPEASVYSVNGSLGVINVSINAQDQLLIYARSGVNGTDVFAGRVLDASGNILVQSVGSMSAPYAYYHTDCELFDNGALVLTNNYRTSLNDPEDYNVRANYGLFLGSPNTGFQVATTTVSGPQRYPSVAKLPNGGFILVWNGNGFQGDSDGAYARAFAAADFPTALPERDALAFEAFPNPFHGQLYLTVDVASPLEVIDATGRVVMTDRLTPGTNSLYTEQLAEGTYLLRWTASDGTILTHRVVKQ